MKHAIIVMGIAFLMTATENIVVLNVEVTVIIRIAQNVAGMGLYIFHQTHQREKPVTIVAAMDISGDREERYYQPSFDKQFNKLIALSLSKCSGFGSDSTISFTEPQHPVKPHSGHGIGQRLYNRPGDGRKVQR